MKFPFFATKKNQKNYDKPSDNPISIKSIITEKGSDFQSKTVFLFKKLKILIELDIIITLALAAKSGNIVLRL